MGTDVVVAVVPLTYDIILLFYTSKSKQDIFSFFLFFVYFKTSCVTNRHTIMLWGGRHVARNLNNMGQWGQQEQPQQDQNSSTSRPFLRYEINSMYCSDPIHVYEFTPPHALFLCSSPLASLLNSYEQLLHKRECSMRADQFNANPSIVMERHSKVTLNEISKSGQALLDTEVKGMNVEKRMSSENQMSMLHTSLENMQTRTHLPADTITVVAPTDYAVHSLDRVLSPQEVMREELAFGRQVAFGMGVPSSLLLQGASAVGATGSSASSGGGATWADGFEGSNRLFIDSCRHINMHVESVLHDAYRKVYTLSTTHAPSFKLPLVPTIPFEQLMTAYNAQLIDDQHFSLILQATWGVGLSKDAHTVREQQHKAEYVLPFRDKKDAPK